MRGCVESSSNAVPAEIRPCGVALYLFVPLAEAVVFAMLASYILSRTLLRLHRAECNARAKLKLREERHTNEKHE
jgi:hypothetical protein